ncbi:MAG: hypothetical protein N4A36_03685, partial [Candidatus Gracilibacteria bacterium]|nr:hypothetical protein [Candidatus Gracilibacteria bacterium]
MKAKTKTNLWKKITIGLGISFVLICAVAIFSLSGIGYKASLSNIENSKDINFNITEQNIKTGDTPSSIKIITDRSFDINLEDGGTGLQGQLTGSNTYEFITTAKTSGVAYLNIIDSDNSLISSRSKINVFDSAPNINISHQKAHLKNQAKSIKIFAGEGDFSFVLDSGETGLTGNKNSENPAIFDFDANSATKTGTATLSIYQKDTSDLIAESKISLYLDNLKANTDSQVVAVGEDLDPFEIHGGSDEYNFEFKAAQTGLEGHQNGNKFVFDNQALQKGNAQLIVSDKNNPEISKALQIVVIESQVSYIDISLTNCNTESTLMVGKTCQLKALATLEDNNQIDLTNLVVWQEYNQIGSINLNKLEISKEGTALITAKFNGVISRNKLNIKSLDSPRLKSIKSKTNCNKGYAFTGQTCALSAIATFDDNSSGDISEFVQWKNAEQFGAIQGLVLKIENIYNGELFAQFGTIISDNTINLETRNLALAQKIKVSTDCDLSSPIDTHDICTLNATGIFEDGDIEVSDAVEWRDFENIGEIHEQNKLLITKAGEANIYAFLNGKKSSNTIDIHTIDTEKIDYFEIYSPNCDTQKSIVINSTCELRVQAIFENGYKGDITHIMDFDGFEQIGSLQSNTLKITSKGQGLIRAFNDQIKMVSNNNIFINVIAPQTLSYFYIESTDCDLTSPIIQGKKCSIYATGVMEDGSMVDISSFVQFQGQNTIGSIENGIIEATNKGQGIIEATYGQARSSNALTVQVKDINSITSFKIHIKDIENGQKLLKDGKYELKAIATLDNGYKTDISDIVKYSGCNDIGVIKGNTLYVQDLGSCSIKASINNKESENTLTIQSVSSSEIESLELTSPN